MCVCVTKWAMADALWPNPSLHSFRSWLIWKINSSSLRRCKNFCRVTWPWPIYLAPKWPPDQNRVFSLCLVDLWENGGRYWSYFHRQLLEKWVWAFERHQAHPTWPLFPIWVENMKKNGKWVFPLSSSDQKLPAADLFVHLSGRHLWRNFRNRCVITLCTLF